MRGATSEHMSVDEFLTWAIDQPRRHELIEGIPVAMAPERAIHARIKANVWSALRDAISFAGLSCEAFPDGLTVRVSDDTAYEPDALVQCGTLIENDAVEAPEPIIVVEVVSPSSAKSDTHAKLDGYFHVPGLHHYLVVIAQENRVVHYQIDKNGDPQANLFHGGQLILEPPGLQLEIDTFFASPA